MIDANSGMLTFETPPASIAPSLTRAQFLVSALAKGAVTFVENEPFHSWKINRTLRSCEVDFLVVLFFSGERLTMISLMNTDPRFGTSWADYSLENEMARKASHDHWLSRAISFQDRYTWGRVDSVYDEKGGFSCVNVHFTAPA